MNEKQKGTCMRCDYCNTLVWVDITPFRTDKKRFDKEIKEAVCPNGYHFIQNKKKRASMFKELI